MKKIRLHVTHDHPGGRFPGFVVIYDQDDVEGETAIGHLALEESSVRALKVGVEVLQEIAPALELPLEISWTGWEPAVAASGSQAGEAVKQIRTVLRMLGLGKEGRV